MQATFTIIQLVLAILLIVLILLQNRGGGLGSVFGGGETSNAFRTKRGLEKKIFYLTIIFSILFLGISIAVLFI